MFNKKISIFFLVGFMILMINFVQAATEDMPLGTLGMQSITHITITIIGTIAITYLFMLARDLGKAVKRGFTLLGLGILFATLSHLWMLLGEISKFKWDLWSHIIFEALSLLGIIMVAVGSKSFYDSFKKIVQIKDK